MLVRTTGLHSALRSILRITTAGPPAAVAARSGALWRLPRPDFHRQAISDIEAHPCHPVDCILLFIRILRGRLGNCSLAPGGRPHP